MAKTTKENKKRKQRKVIIDDKRISINFYTEREFQEKYRKLLTREEERKKITFKKIAEAWQNQHYETIEEYTQNCYDAPVKDAISWFGNRLVNDIKPTDIQDRINQMYMQGYAKQTIKLPSIALKTANLLNTWRINMGRRIYKNISSLPPFMTVKETADLLRRHPVIIRQYCRDGIIPACKLGKSWEISSDALYELIQNGGLS